MATTKKIEPVKMTPTQMKKKIEALEEEIRVYKEDTAWCYMCGKPKKKNRENYYEITDDGLIEQFSLFTDLFSSNNDLESIVPVSCAAKVIEKDAVTVDVTYSYESSLIGKVSLEFTNVGTTEISGVNDYISSNKLTLVN